MSDYKIRKLTRKDRKTLSDLIKKMVSSTGDKGILSILNDTDSGAKDVSEEEKKGAMISLGISLLNQLLEVLDNDMAVWFADLIGVTPEKFDTCDFGIEAEIVEQIVASKEISDFFSSVSRTSNTIKMFGGQSKKGKTL